MRATTALTIDTDGIHTTRAKIRRASPSCRDANPGNQITLLTTSTEGGSTAICIAKEEVLLEIGSGLACDAATKDTEAT